MHVSVYSTGNTPLPPPFSRRSVAHCGGTDTRKMEITNIYAVKQSPGRNVFFCRRVFLVVFVFLNFHSAVARRTV